MYFTDDDFRCKCGKCVDGPTITPELRGILEEMRDWQGFTVSSGVRCAYHNALVKGKPDSRHLPQYADAVDILCMDSVSRHRLMVSALLRSVKVIEIAPAHLHLDMRPGLSKIILVSEA